MQFLSFIYAFLIIFLTTQKRYIFALCVILTLPVVIGIYFGFKKYQIKKYKNLIENAKKSLADNKEVTPFININYAPVYILELIPGLRRIDALKIHNMQNKNKRIENFVEYANLTSLPLAFYEINKRIIIF